MGLSFDLCHRGFDRFILMIHPLRHIIIGPYYIRFTSNRVQQTSFQDRPVNRSTSRRVWQIPSHDGSINQSTSWKVQPSPSYAGSVNWSIQWKVWQILSYDRFISFWYIVGLIDSYSCRGHQLIILNLWWVWQVPAHDGVNNVMHTSQSFNKQFLISYT